MSSNIRSKFKFKFFLFCQNELGIPYLLQAWVERTSVMYLKTGMYGSNLYECENWRFILTFRHRASCILGQAFHYSPENAFYIFNQQIYFKSVPLQAWSGPEGSRKLRFPDFITTAQGGGKVVSHMHRPHFPLRKFSWYSFLTNIFHYLIFA